MVQRTPYDAVSAEEVAERIAEWRRHALQGKVAPQVVYQPAKHACPWDDCHLPIAGIRFNLHRLGNAKQQEEWLESWWAGPGLLVRCPRCRRLLLLGLHEKEAIADPSSTTALALPDDWHKLANILPECDH